LNCVFLLPPTNHSITVPHSHPAPPESAKPLHVLAIAWPLLAELVLGFGVGFVGMWLVSKESDTAAAAFGLANHVQGAFFLLFRIISMGVGVVITQNLGARNRRDADRTALASLGASTWLGLGSALLLLLTTDPLLSAMQATPDVRALAGPYLYVLALVLVLDAFNASMAAVMRSHLHTRETMFNILSMHALHIALCFPLMRGTGPIAPMGMIGFALALAISRAMGLGVHLWLWRSGAQTGACLARCHCHSLGQPALIGSHWPARRRRSHCLPHGHTDLRHRCFGHGHCRVGYPGLCHADHECNRALHRGPGFCG
jgi:Na+-driven multidrug efflux pump